MIAGEPSRTAQGAALHRAAHQLVDRPPLFTDPLALRIVGDEAAAELRAGHERRAQPAAAALRAFIAARSRYAEDRAAELHARGLGQYVVLGAGLDTFGYRARCDGLRVYEVDHPATQAWKRRRLAQAAIDVPETVAYAPVDFERETLREALARSAFDFERPALFSWLGVTPYLTRAAIFVALGVIVRHTAPGSEVIFDFAAPPSDDARARAARAAFAARVEAAGEPLRSALAPAALRGELLALGFARADVVDHETLNAHYFAQRTDGLRLTGGQLAHATV